MDSISKNELSGNNGHPSEDELLLYVDGELEAKATNHVRNHLEACWSCRVRTEKIEETISSFIDYRNQVLKPLVEPPPQGWRGFDGRLNRLVNEVGRPSLFANVAWSTNRVFAQTCALAARLGLSTRQLDRLSDVDRPEDLAIAPRPARPATWVSSVKARSEAA